VSRTWVQQVFLPLVPGVDSLLEPLQDQAEDAQVLFSVTVGSQGNDGIPAEGMAFRHNLYRSPKPTNISGVWQPRVQHSGYRAQIMARMLIGCLR